MRFQQQRSRYVSQIRLDQDSVLSHYPQFKGARMKCRQLSMRDKTVPTWQALCHRQVRPNRSVPYHLAVISGNELIDRHRH